MSYRRALLVTDVESDPGHAFSALRRVAPALELLVIVVRLPVSAFAWFTGASAPEPEPVSLAHLEALRERAARVASNVQVELAPELNVEALVELVRAMHVDLLVLGARTRQSIAIMSAVQKRETLPMLASDVDAPDRAMHRIVCIALGQRGRETIGLFLRDHVAPSVHVTLLSPGTPPPEDLAARLEVAGIEAAVHPSTLGATALRAWLDAWTHGARIDLFVFARVPATLLLGAPLLPAPVLLLPPHTSARSFWQRPIDVPDLIDDGGPLRARVDYVAAVGDLVPVPDQPIAFVSGGRVVATVHTRAGALELPSDLDASSFGVFRATDGAPLDTLTAIEQWVSVIRTGERPIVLFDAELADDVLAALHERVTELGAEALAVRLRPTSSCRSIRERLRRLGLPAHVIDARAVLDEGEALDVSDVHDPIRLARVAAHLRGVGFPVTAIVHGGAIEPATRGFVAWSATEPSSGWTRSSPTSGSALPLGARERLQAFAPIAGNRIEVELDNRLARTWLFDAIAQSRESVHLQVYMAQDDHVGIALEAALAQAGARGVRVRVLIDSLHGLHGSFGISNPLLERLARIHNVEVRTWRPIVETPSLAELKQRDHRKLVVIDGQLALVGGRNLSHEYYTGFDEARIHADSLWREVPWLDAGARVQGPAVGALAASFLEAWTDAGGARFDLQTPPPVGTTATRVVVHRGLRDTNTLEAYLDMVDGARSHVTVVNGFPLVLELQHALMRARRRGVRVRALVGHVTPTHDGQPFKGPWGPARVAATELVHSRFDALGEAGAEIHHFAVRDVPGWERGLGVVHPHVHAKVVSVDGVRSSVGSANLDITSAYWESELLLVIEDAALTRTLDAQLDALFAQSVRVAYDEPAFQQAARRRAWMRHWPGVLSL